MSGQRWPDCDRDAAAFVRRIVDALRDELGDRLVGVYLHGSLALGSYYPPKSDIDLLVVVRDPLDAVGRERVARLFVALSDERPTTGGVEVSVLTEAAVRSFEHPLCYEVHHSPMWTERIRSGDVDYAGQGRDPDLAAHVSSVRERGVALFGPEPVKLFAPVPEDDFLASILDDLDWIIDDENILESPFYGVLNGCRVMMALADPSLRTPSKEEGALWALEHFPVEQHAIVRAALDAYRSSAPVSEDKRQTAGLPWDREALLAFRDFLRATRASLP